jgi:hypothetical protein
MLPQHGAARSDGGQVGRMGWRPVHAALVKLELGKTYDFSHGHAAFLNAASIESTVRSFLAS